MGKRGKNDKKGKNFEGEIFAQGCEIFAHGCEIFAHGCEIFASVLFFWSTFPFDFKSVKLFLTRILYAWVDSTNLALIACKNY